MNYLAILVATVAGWSVGALWYSGVLFGKRWQKELGFSDEYLKQANMALTFGGSLIMMFIMNYGVAAIINSLPEPNLESGLKTGLYAGIMIAGAGMAVNYLYQQKSLMLWLIDGIYQIILLTVGGAIIGAWR